MNTLVYPKKAYRSLKRKIFKLWDPDFTKLTLRERISLQKSEREIKKGEYFTDEEVWK